MNPNFISVEKWQSLLPRYETWRNSKIFPQKWSSERWQSLHLIHVQKILVCAVNVHHSFPSLHTYDFKAAPYWSCSSRHELTSSPCSALSNNFTPVQLHVMHTELTSATVSQLGWGAVHLTSHFLFSGMSALVIPSCSYCPSQVHFGSHTGCSKWHQNRDKDVGIGSGEFLSIRWGSKPKRSTLRQ